MDKLDIKLACLGVAMVSVGAFFINISTAFSAPVVYFTSGPSGCYATGDSVQYNWNWFAGSTGEATSIKLGYSFSSSAPASPQIGPLSIGTLTYNLPLSGEHLSDSFYFWIWGVDANGNTVAGPVSHTPPIVVKSSRSQCPDTNPPSHISDLAVSGTPTATSVPLRWTVPWDNSGSIANYQIRYIANQSAPMTDGQWSSATPVSNPPAPLSYGSLQSFIFTDAVGGVTYALGIKSCDASGNCPGPSVINFTTPGGDTQAPSGVTGFYANSIGTTNVQLWWASAYDNVGVTSYQIRYKANQSYLYEADWPSATIVSNPPAPLTPAGTSQSFSLSGLTENIQYAVGIKACDAAGNCSYPVTTSFRTQTSYSATSTTPYYPPATSCSGWTGPIPGTITDLHIMSYGNPPEIMWLVPAGAARYEIRALGSGTTLSEANWNSALLITLSELPSTSCSNSTQVKLPGLSSSVYYSIGIKAISSTGQMGPISNITGLTPSSSTSQTSTTTTPTYTPTPTPSTTGSIKVIVKGPDGALRDINLALNGKSSPYGYYSGVTQANGEYTFSQIPSGSYTLSASTPSYRTDLNNVTDIWIDLSPYGSVLKDVYLSYRSQAPTSTSPYPIPQPVPQPQGTSLCGGVYGYNENGSPQPLPNSRVLLSVGSLNWNTVTDNSGRFCFNNLGSGASGPYIITAEAPAGRTELSSPMTGNATLYPNTQSTHDMYFSRAYNIPAPPTPTPEPPVYRLPYQEQCIRDALGEERYRLMKRGKQPSPEEYEKVKACFGFIPAPIPGPVPEPHPEPVPPVFNDECERRELPRIKSEMKKFSRKIDSIEKQADRLRRDKITLPTNFLFLITKARDIFSKIQSAKTCDEAFTSGSELPDIMQQLDSTLGNISRLSHAPKIIKEFEREVQRIVTRIKSGIKTLSKRKFDVSVLNVRLSENQKEANECKARALQDLNALDPEGFEETMRSCFELLDDLRELMDVVKAIDKARSYLAGGIDRILKQASRLVKTLERQGKDEEFAIVKGAMDELKEKRDEVLADYRNLQKDQDELLDALTTVAGLYSALEDAMSSARGISTYEEVAGKPARTFERVELTQPIEQFFKRTP